MRERGKAFAVCATNECERTGKRASLASEMKRGVQMHPTLPLLFLLPPPSLFLSLLLSLSRAHREECLRERVYTIPTTDKTRSLVSPVGKKKNRARVAESARSPRPFNAGQFSRRGDSAALPRRKMQLDEETVAAALTRKLRSARRP